MEGCGSKTCGVKMSSLEGWGGGKKGGDLVRVGGGRGEEGEGRGEGEEGGE